MELPRNLSPTDLDILQRLCQPSEKWAKRFLADDWRGAYQRMSELATEIVRLIDRGQEKNRLNQFFDTLEELWVEQAAGGPGLDLLGAGLLEYLQERSRSGGMKQPELLEEMLRPVTRKSWIVILKGFFGENIDTIDKLNRVLLQESVEKYKIDLLRFKRSITIERSGPTIQTVRLLYTKSLGQFKNADQEQELGLNKPTVRIEAWYHNAEVPEVIVLGKFIADDSPIRYASYKGELYWIDLAEFLGDWGRF